MFINKTENTVTLDKIGSDLVVCKITKMRAKIKIS